MALLRALLIGLILGSLALCGGFAARAIREWRRGRKYEEEAKCEIDRCIEASRKARPQ